jgi:hypothetical protein
MHGLKSGNEVLKQIHKEMNIESVEKLLDETHEAQAYQQVRSSHILLLPKHMLNYLCSGNQCDVGQQSFIRRGRGSSSRT